MTKHFAGSWLDRLSEKMRALEEWSRTPLHQQGPIGPHGMLFKEFFSQQFQRTLALVDESKKAAFLSTIESNLFKFDVNSQQFPLMCLCAMFQHGKESATTQERVMAWIENILGRLRTVGGTIGPLGPIVVVAAMEECCTEHFQKFLPLVEASLSEKLADVIGERMVEVNQDLVKKILDKLPLLLERVFEVVDTCTKNLNIWMQTAPRFPATPIFLYDTLVRLEQPLVRQYIHIQKLEWKESFLVATSLALAGLKSRFAWMMTAEPELRTLCHGLEQKFFYVTGHGARMESWLSSRLRHYNGEVTAAVKAMLGNAQDAESLRARIIPTLPKRRVQEDDDDVPHTWIGVAGPNAAATALLDWLRESRPGFNCPPHTLNPRTLMGILQSFPSTFEVDTGNKKVRLRPPSSIPQAFTPPPPPAPPAAKALPPVPPFPPLPGRSASGPLSGSILAPPKPNTSGDVMPFVLPGHSASKGEAAVSSASAGPAPPTSLIDLLLQEAISSLDSATQAKIHKVSHGVYKMGSKEVTFHTIDGKLWVHHVGDVARNIPIETLLKEEGLAVPPSLTGTLPSSSSRAMQVAATAAENAARTEGASKPTIFHPAVTNLGRENSAAAGARNAEALKGKTEQATKQARDLARTMARRFVNFEDDGLLRLLILKGIKHDYYWEQAFKEFNNMPEMDAKSQKEVIKSLPRAKVEAFVEENTMKYLSEEWFKKVLEGAKQAPPKDGKDKKDKGKKDKKDKKRQGASSASSDGKKQGGQGVEAFKQAGKRMASQGQHPDMIHQHHQGGYGHYGGNPYGMPMMMPGQGMMPMHPMGYPQMEHANKKGRR